MDFKSIMGKLLRFFIKLFYLTVILTFLFLMGLITFLEISGKIKTEGTFIFFDGLCFICILVSVLYFSEFLESEKKEIRDKKRKQEGLEQRLQEAERTRQIWERMQAQRYKIDSVDLSWKKYGF